MTDLFSGLYGLSLKFGLETACKIYKRLEKSLDCLESIAYSLGNDCEFTRLHSLLFTQSEDASYDLRKEYLIRRHNGFKVNVLQNNIHHQNGNFNFEFGIITQNMSATVDPFIFTHMILSAAKDCGARIYENSPVEEIIAGKKSPCVRTKTNRHVHTNKVIVSGGGSNNKFLKAAGIYKTKFSIATKPISNMSTYRDNYIIASKLDYPEITFSVTKDKRVIVSGLSTKYTKENKKTSGIIPISVMKKSKYSHLRKELATFFPDIKNTDIEFKFYCNFLETDNGLPLIIQHSSYPDCYFNVCPGENNIIFSEIMSEILLDLYKGKKIDFEDIFIFKK